MLKVVALLALVSLMVQATTPSGFTQLNDKYFISKTTDTFFGALLACRGSGYKMVSVRSEEEYLRLNNSIQTRRLYWLGGAHIDSENFQSKWFWLESGDELTYTNWAKYEPTLLSGNTCLERSSNGVWYSQSCSNYYYYICEK